MEWSRRVKGITSEIKYQAAKPSGKPDLAGSPGCDSELTDALAELLVLAAQLEAAGAHGAQATPFG